MKSRSLRLALVSLFALHTAQLGAGPANPSASDTRTPAAVAEKNAEFVKGFVVVGMLKKTIGSLACYSFPTAGDTFEIDLGNLPTKEIKFWHPSAEVIAKKSDASANAPLAAPLAISQVSQWQKLNQGTTAIYLRSTDAAAEFRIQIVAERWEKGSSVRIVFERRDELVSAMVEAEGVLK